MSKNLNNRKIHTISINTDSLYYEIANICAIAAESIESQNVKLKRNLTDATTSNNRDIVTRYVYDALAKIRLSLPAIVKSVKYRNTENYDDDEVKSIDIQMTHSDAIDNNEITTILHNYIVNHAAAAVISLSTSSQLSLQYQLIAADNLSLLMTTLLNDYDVDNDVSSLL